MAGASAHGSHQRVHQFRPSTPFEVRVDGEFPFLLSAPVTGEFAIARQTPLKELALLVTRPESLFARGFTQGRGFNWSARREFLNLPRRIRRTHVMPPSASDTAHHSAVAIDTN
jgi:hypothetical protein